MSEDRVRGSFADRLQGAPRPCALAHYVGPWNNRSLFRALAHAIQVLVVEREAPYPVERTLWTTQMLEAAVQSLHQQGPPIDTPHLAVGYTPRDWRRVRENGETWKLITPETPEPPGIKRDPAPARSAESDRSRARALHRPGGNLPSTTRTRRKTTPTGSRPRRRSPGIGADTPRSRRPGSSLRRCHPSG